MRALVLGVLTGWLVAAPAMAQGQQTAASEPAQMSMSAGDRRPATTTFLGDTGLWFVPTGEVLPHRLWSASAYRVNFDRQQGFTDVSFWPVTFGLGVGERTEVFGSFRIVSRIDRDHRPIFGNALVSEGGGVYHEFPFVKEGWSSNDIGDFIIGAKFNILSESRQQPVALALRGYIKLPTGSKDEGSSTGKADFSFDAIVSKELAQKVELSGFGGLYFRGSPDGIELPNSLKWGIGAGFPSRKSLRLTTELVGEFPLDDTVLNSLDFRGVEDGSRSPVSSPTRKSIDAIIGLTWQHANGFFIGSGVSLGFNQKSRSNFGPFEDESGDYLGFQFRIGYHPGVAVYTPPAPPQPPLPVPPVPGNRPPVVKARCNPCTVEVCKTSTVTGDASDPDGDPLTYRWTAPTGSFANPSERETVWTAPCEPGPVPVTITVDDGKSGTASDSVTIQVVRPVVKEHVFEDVHFDFDRYSLRPDAARVLDEAIKAMQTNATLRIQVEGHTCNIGTAEYNLALGERRANAVKEYLTTRGIGADRLETISYGEERPKHDNAREETRRLNRRAALVVRLVSGR